MAQPRRFPPPWTVEELDACFVVIDSAEQKLAYVYFEEEAGALGSIAAPCAFFADEGLSFCGMQRNGSRHPLRKISDTPAHSRR